MDTFYRLQNLEFEWDVNKAQLNFKKHGVTFEQAAEVFFDPFYQEGDASVNQEDRNFILGYTLAQKMLLVVYIERDIRIRLISARPATIHERRHYETGL